MQKQQIAVLSFSLCLSFLIGLALRATAFDLNLKVDPVSLTSLNDFARAYGNFDFEKGTLAVAAELARSMAS